MAWISAYAGGAAPAADGPCSGCIDELGGMSTISLGSPLGPVFMSGCNGAGPVSFCGDWGAFLSGARSIIAIRHKKITVKETSLAGGVAAKYKAAG